MGSVSSLAEIPPHPKSELEGFTDAERSAIRSLVSAFGVAVERLRFSSEKRCVVTFRHGASLEIERREAFMGLHLSGYFGENALPHAFCVLLWNRLPRVEIRFYNPKGAKDPSIIRVDQVQTAFAVLSRYLQVRRTVELVSDDDDPFPDVDLDDE